MNWALTPSRVEAGFWLIITVALAAGVGLESEWGRQMPRPVTQIAEIPPVVVNPVLAEPFHLADPDQFLDITLRPLFVVTRRPAPVAPTADSKSSMKKDQFILLGTTIVAEDKFAFLLEKAGNKSRVVAVGKEINGIMVKEVAADRVVLSQDDDTEVLVLKTNKPPPGAPARPAVAPGAGPPTAVAPGVAPPPAGLMRPIAAPQPRPQPQATIGPR